MNNYSENLFAAIDTIIAERLNKLNFDRTGIYTIVGQYEKDKTKYWVTDGSIRFLATASEGALYSQNQQVYVTIPQNNYDGEKVILGAYSSTDTTKNTQTYVDPYSRFVKDVSINIPKENYIVTQIQGTSDKTSTIISKTIPFTTHHPNQPYDYIGVTMAFDVNIKGYDGNYALIFEFQDSNNKTLHGKPTPDDLTDLDGNLLVISSKQMHGNPFNLIPNLIYNFVLPYPQEMKPEDIHHVNIILAQDGYFTNVGNIILTDLELAFGYNKDNLKANTSILEIGANDTLKYADYDKVKTRTLNLDWVYQDAKTKEFSIFHQYNLPTDIFEEYTIYWLHYVDGAGENKNLSNAYNWVTLETNTDFSYQITLDTALKTDQYKAVVKYKLKPEEEEKTEDTTSTDKEDTTTIKKEEYLYTEAEGLIFESTQLHAEPGAANASGDAIRFSFLNNCNGVFNYYGLDDHLSDTSGDSGPYTIVANFLDSTKWDVGNNDSRIEKVEWITPTVNTMINTDKDIVISDNKKELSFYIKTIYLHEATNNRIECVVTFKNGAIRRGSINLQFGQNQTNGTTYAFNIDFVGTQNCLYLAGGAASEIQVQASFTKSNGDPVAIPPITWSWVHLTEAGENASGISIEKITDNLVTLRYFQPDFPKQNILNKKDQYANFSILQATIENYNAENGVTVDLKAYLPIPLVKEDYTHIAGATRIVYDTLGNSVSFSRNPYALYKGNEEESRTVYWKCIAGPGQTEGVPKLGTTTNENKLYYSLKPVSYCPPEIPMACIAAYVQTGVKKETTTEGETVDKPITELVWLQPLLIIQNSWNSDMINDWDGSVEIDTEKGNIKSPIFMAGKKTDNNKFTGVVLGDVQRASIRDAVGLYGFQDSWLRYKLDENGAFYVGSGNNNFISFNENGAGGRSGANELVIKTNNFMLDVTDDEGKTLLYLSNVKNNNQAWLQFEEKLFLGPTKAEIVGWQMAKTSEGSYFYSGDKNKTFAVLKSAGDVCFAVGAPSHEITTGAKLQIFHDGRFRAGYNGTGYNFTVGADGTIKIIGELILKNDIGSAALDGNRLQLKSEGIEWFEAWPSDSDTSCVLSGRNGISITDTEDSTNTNLASFTPTGALITVNDNNSITFKARGNDKAGHINLNTDYIHMYDDINGNDTCLLDINGGLYASCCATVNNKKGWYYTLKTGRTQQGGDLYGTWTQPNWSSDARLKHSIEILSQQYDILFDNLQPKRYKYNNGTSDRYHTGFIAQEVLEAVNKAKLSTQDFAAMYLTPRDDSGLGDEPVWILRRDEFVSLNTWQIQKLKTRVAQLEQEIKELKNEI